MQIDSAAIRKIFSRDLVDILVRVGLIGSLVILCVRVFSPFMGLMLWGLILAMALYPLHKHLVKRLRGRQGTAATVLVMTGLLVIGLPTVILGSSFAGHLHEVYSNFQDKTITIPQPDQTVAEWPLVGKKVYHAWQSAATNLPAFLEKVKPQLEQFTRHMLSLAASTAGGLFMFLGSLILAGIMMAYGESGSAAMKRILCRLSGPVRGPKLHSLSTATVRSVATGVIGVAFIQALLLGIGFILADIPAAGVLAVFVLLLGIAQLPAAIVFIPAIAYIWGYGDASTVSNVFFTVYLVVAGLSDNLLKPLLLGRGVEAPMPIILLGAVGGMVSAGIIGLFIGSVLLAVGYQIFMEWVDEAESDDLLAEPEQPDPPSPDTPVSD
ncbi:MAG: AI-2E family transporter [Gammaproteobacteria bacterium]|nr:AI-2E family transporter [Gammaproteobacteria bacterium]